MNRRIQIQIAVSVILIAAFVVGKNWPAVGADGIEQPESPPPPIQRAGELADSAASVETANVVESFVGSAVSQSVVAEEPVSCPGGLYDGWSQDDIAQDVIAIYQQGGYIHGTPIVEAFAELYPEHAERFGTSSLQLEFGCIPDLAMVLEGDFSWPQIGRDATPRQEPYVLLVVDRDSGAVLYRSHSDTLQHLLDRLPPY